MAPYAQQKAVHIALAKQLNPLQRFLILYPISYRLLAAPLACVVTLALMVLMERLVHTDELVPDDTPVIALKPIWHEERVVKPVHDKTELPVKPVEPDTQVSPEPPTVTVDPTETHIGIPGIKFVQERTGPIIRSSGDPIPQVQVQPDYPRRAADRGIEGFVDLQFDVTTAGATENIRILAAQPEGYFERAAHAAVARWKYRPAIADGEPVYKKDMQTRVTFQMEKTRN